MAAKKKERKKERKKDKHALNLSTKSPKREAVSALARTIPTLAAADEHPEEMDEFEHHFRAGFGPPDAAFCCCIKTTRATHTLGSVHPPSWAPLATDLPQLLPSLPSYTRAPARSPLVHRACLCAEDPPSSSTSLQSRPLEASDEKKRQEEGESKYGYLFIFLQDFIGLLKHVKRGGG